MIIFDPVDVLQLNICHSGAASCYTGEEPVTAKSVSVIGSTKPQAQSVNEACEGGAAGSCELPWARRKRCS